LSPDPFPRFGELLPVEKGVFTKKKFLVMVRVVNFEMEKKS
jgi:hypothetical protein